MEKEEEEEKEEEVEEVRTIAVLTLVEVLESFLLVLDLLVRHARLLLIHHLQLMRIAKFGLRKHQYSQAVLRCCTFCKKFL